MCLNINVIEKEILHINKRMKEMKYEYYYYKFYREYLEKYLQTKGIKYKKYECDVVGDHLQFSVWSTDENYETIIDYMKYNRML